MSYQPIKFTKKQYYQLKKLIQKEFGNVSMTKGIYLITFIYDRHLNKNIRNYYRKKYYVKSKTRGGFYR